MAPKYIRYTYTFHLVGGRDYSVVAGSKLEADFEMMMRYNIDVHQTCDACGDSMYYLLSEDPVSEEEYQRYLED